MCDASCCSKARTEKETKSIPQPLEHSHHSPKLLGKGLDCPKATRLYGSSKKSRQRHHREVLKSKNKTKHVVSPQLPQAPCSICASSCHDLTTVPWETLGQNRPAHQLLKLDSQPVRVHKMLLFLRQYEWFIMHQQFLKEKRKGENDDLIVSCMTEGLKSNVETWWSAIVKGW